MSRWAYDVVWVYDLSALPQLGAPYGVCGRLSVWDCDFVPLASNLRLSLRRALVLAPDCRSGAPPSGPGSTRAPYGVWGPYGTTPLAHPIVRSSRTFVSVRAPAWEGRIPPWCALWQTSVQAPKLAAVRDPTDCWVPSEDWCCAPVCAGYSATESGCLLVLAHKFRRAARDLPYENPAAARAAWVATNARVLAARPARLAGW